MKIFTCCLMDELCSLQHLLWVCPSRSTLDGKALRERFDRSSKGAYRGGSQGTEGEGGGGTDTVVAVARGGK